QVVSSLDQRVTQWISSVTDARGRDRTSAHFSMNGDSTSPQTRKSHRERSGYSGVRPKVEDRELLGQHLPGRDALDDLRVGRFLLPGQHGSKPAWTDLPRQGASQPLSRGPALCRDVLAWGPPGRRARLGPMPPAASSPFATFAATADAI